MRIVIDMQGAQTASRFRGIGRYTVAFVQAILRNRGEHEIILALSGLFPDTIEHIRASFEGLLPQENIRVWYAPSPVGKTHVYNDHRGETAELLREAFLASLKPDVIHISSFFEGYGDDAVTSIGRFDQRIPVSVILYDLIPLLNADHYLKPVPSYEQYYLRKVEFLKRADLLLAISRFSREEAITTLNLDQAQTITVSTAFDSHFCSQIIEDKTACQIRAKFNISRPFVLYTGGADERKNLPRLIDAYAALPTNLRNTHQLVFAGKIDERNEAIFMHLAQLAGFKHDELILTGYISDKDLIHLYNLCQLYVFPSWHEGFGLPALEAMACGAPVIGSNTASLPEVIGLDEALFDPFNVTAISRKITQALEDGPFRARLCAHGLEQAKNFSWNETAKHAIAAWESLHKPQLAESHPKRSGLKPRLAYVSPMPPERTEIADYSAELLPALSAYYDIDVVVAQDSVDDSWANQHTNLHDVGWLRAHANEIDRVIYQLGDSPSHWYMLQLMEEIPGTVVLHDFYMSGLMAWLELHAGQADAWSGVLYESHGYGALRERFTDVEATKRIYPANWHILRQAQGIIVHSSYSRTLAQQWYGPDTAANWALIPLLRAPAGKIDKLTARRALGIDADNFVICSFGFLAETKLSHRLIDAFLSSELSRDSRCCLIFVGENESGLYGAGLLKRICDSGLQERIRITGFVSSEVFRQYLTAADLAVQLRTISRGESSSTVLDCMNYGLPVIVNGNGSMTELDTQAVCMLPDQFADTELIEALQTLWRDSGRRQAFGNLARQVILERHAPDECARQYAVAIEHFHRDRSTGLHALLRACAEQNAHVPDDADLFQLSDAIATTLPLARPAKRLFLDITATYQNDCKTSIERVAKGLLMALLESPPAGYRVEPIYLSEVAGMWQHRYARKYTMGLLACSAAALIDDPIDPQNGDLLICVDISGHLLINAAQSGLFARYRNLGVLVYSVVYDLLPIRMPEVFPPGAADTHTQWLQAITTLDGAICISASVAADLATWLQQVGRDWQGRRPHHIGWWPLGTDMAKSVSSTGLPGDSASILTQLAVRPSFLMVGTLEPRKGYLQSIEAFTQLWSEGLDVNLVIVGKEGWKELPDEMRRDIPQTVARLRSHPEWNTRLFWIEGASDEYLEKIYSTSACLLAASYDEGFGLPLVAAAQYKLPILARNIPVFREVAGIYANYFDAADARELALALREWSALYKDAKHSKSDGIPRRLTLKQSAAHLMDVVLNKASDANFFIKKYN